MFTHCSSSENWVFASQNDVQMQATPNIQWLSHPTLAGRFYLQYQVCLREAPCVSSEAFFTERFWETMQQLTTDELRCLLTFTACYYEIAMWKSIELKQLISAEQPDQKHFKSWFADCCFPKLTLFWDTHTLPEEVSSRRNCSRESSDKGCF